MKKLLIAVSIITFFTYCGGEDSKSESNVKEIIVVEPINSFVGYSNQEIISRFLNYMDWYKENTEFNKTSLKVRKIDNYTYSIKFEEWHWVQVDKFCFNGSTCMECYGEGTKRKTINFNPYFINVECSDCKGSGTVRCPKIKKSFSKIATMKFQDADKFFINFQL